MSSILSHDRMKNPIFWERFQLFRHQTESNMCSSALFPSRLSPSKAPLSTGRSWVQSLVMTEWKNLIFSENFNFSDFKPGCNKFYSGPGRTSLHRDWPLPKSPLPPGGKRRKFPHPFRAKHCYISKSFNYISTSDRERMCSSAPFPPRLPPSKAPLSTGRSWSSILSHGRMKKSYFLGKFRVFLH